MGPRVPAPEAAKETRDLSYSKELATFAFPSSARARVSSAAVRLPALTALVTCSCSASVTASESRIVRSISALSAEGAPEDHAILLAAK